MTSSDPNGGMSRDDLSDPSAPPSEPGRDSLDSNAMEEEFSDLSDPSAPPSEPGREQADGAGDDESLRDAAGRTRPRL